jgi:serine protease Do
VIISRDGLVLTAAHVISRPGLDASIRLANGNIVGAKTKGLVHLLDSGLLKISDPGEYDYLDMGDSGSLNLGQWVMAVGHPGGYEAARGMVVRVGRILTLTSRVIRSDCALVGGDSGGPLVDMDGNVIGIHSRIGARLTDNMHVPIGVYANGWDELESDQEVGGPPRMPSLGVRLKGDGDGLEIEEVLPAGPAEKAGIKPGDVIVEINGKSIATRGQLADEINTLQIGGEAKIKVLRGTDEHKIRIVVGRR